jgi:hypothetical protein
MCGDAEEDDGRDTEILDLITVLHEIVYGLLVIAGHGTDLFFYALPVGYEKRINKIVRGKLRFPYHTPDVLVGPKPSRTIQRLEHEVSRFTILLRSQNKLLLNEAV